LVTSIVNVGVLPVTLDYCSSKALVEVDGLVEDQGEIHKEYLLHTFDLYQSYCGAPPRFSRRLDKRTGKVYYSGRFELFLYLFCHSYEKA